MINQVLRAHCGTELAGPLAMAHQGCGRVDSTRLFINVTQYLPGSASWSSRAGLGVCEWTMTKKIKFYSFFSAACASAVAVMAGLQYLLMEGRYLF